jgi:hypothetical protein
MADTALPILAEHQAPEVSSQTTGYQPSDEEKQTIKMVNQLFEKAKKHRKKYDEPWPDYYKYFRGKQWKESRPSYRHSEVVNFIFQTIQSQAPILADARQRIEFVAQEPNDTEFAKILDDCAESDWQYGNWTYQLAEMLYDGHILGTGLGGIHFDAEARLGEGSIVFESEDPWWIYPDPNARNVNQKCNYIIKAMPVDIAQLKREYPEKAKFIKSDITDLTKDFRDDLDPNLDRYKSPVDNRTVLEGTSPYDLGNTDQVLKIECDIFDEEIIEEKQTEVDEMGKSTDTFIQKLKFPQGRKICMAGGVLLSDGPMPLEEKKFSFFRFVNYIDARCFWGISEVEQLKGPQNIFNKIYSFTLDVLTLMGNPIWIVDNDSGVDTDNLYNRPGLVVEKSKGTEVRREEGTQLQPYVLQILDRVREYIDGVSGSSDVTRGVRPEGITAASAISQLQEAAQTRIRQKARNLDATLQDFGQLYKSYAMQFYSAPRVFRVTNAEGSNKYFKLHIEPEKDQDGNETGKKIAKVRNYVQDPETGNYAEELKEKEYLIRGDFDIKVTTGSSLPFAKDQKFSKARQMFLDGVIDDEEYLKQSDYPNWQTVLQRVNQKKQEQMQQQMAAQGGGGQAPPPDAGGAPPPGGGA